MKNPPILISVSASSRRSRGSASCSSACGSSASTGSGCSATCRPFEHVGLWGWLAVATGIVWLLAALGLWALQPWARLFAMIIAGFALFEAVLAFFQFPGTGVGFGMAIMPAADPLVPRLRRGQGRVPGDAVGALSLLTVVSEDVDWS